MSKALRGFGPAPFPRSGCTGTDRLTAVAKDGALESRERGAESAGQGA